MTAAVFTLQQNKSAEIMASDLIRIGDIEKFSIVDFPSKIAAVVFMQGCPWRCPFCYNASLQNPNSKDETGWDKLIHLLEHRKGILDAVVFSGGEPLMQVNLPQAMDEVKAMGFEVGLHTGGYNPEALKKLIDKVSWVGMDIKVPLETERYSRITGCPTPVGNIKESLKILLDSGVHFECRTTCDPRILDIEDIYKIAEELSAAGVKEYYLQKYRPVAEDKTTTEADCDKFFNDTELLTYLKSKFEIFDVRK
ncbi:MAG: anaerobic ribonucleoside-triphosphate reductase activating protein [Pseudomonadota bacterium]|nr:anaerobic ribonucleoside-triphosphate reductase activating protein [Pseudomonadota bacterium]